MGVGRAGIYRAHAHRGFTDVAFAPGGMRVGEGPEAKKDRVHVTSPGNWFGPLEFYSNFWFLKLFTDRDFVCEIPDKVVDQLGVTGRECLVSDALDSPLNLFEPSRGNRTIRLRTIGDTLEARNLEADGGTLVVTP